MSGQSAAVFEARGHRVYVANARKLRAISASHTKSDEEDAQMLARLGRADPKLLSPVRHRSEVTQRALVRLKVREALVRSRVNLINSARFLRKTLEDPKHFAHARSVGPYLGLVPRRDQSGETDKQLPITKAGHAQLRCLLVNCAHYILGPFGPPCVLRTAGARIAARGGKSAKKRAVIAVARKLAVTLLALWKTGAEYRPEPQPLAQAA